MNESLPNPSNSIDQFKQFVQNAIEDGNSIKKSLSELKEELTALEKKCLDVRALLDEKTDPSNILHVSAQSCLVLAKHNATKVRETHDRLETDIERMLDKHLRRAAFFENKDLSEAQLPPELLSTLSDAQNSHTIAIDHVQTLIEQLRKTLEMETKEMDRVIKSIQ